MIISRRPGQDLRPRRRGLLVMTYSKNSKLAGTSITVSKDPLKDEINVNISIFLGSCSRYKAVK